MKKTMGIVLGLGLAVAAQAAIIEGQIIGIDFGASNAVGAVQFNVIGGAGGNNTTLGYAADGIVTDNTLIDITGAAVTGVGFSWQNADQIAWDFGLAAATDSADGIVGDGTLMSDVSVYGDAIICNDASGRTLSAGVDFMYFTFTGLDNSLTYNLSAGFDNGNANFNQTFAADGQSVTTGVDGSGGGFASLTGLSTDGSGNLLISLTGVESAAHITIAGMTLQAIPEPGTLGLVAAFGGAVLFIRRRFML
ncbi:hypothetical protein PDESU_01765 [Pontiella desulfatans]|uniref:PEP-CTERM protein-sorting domain-containing protein n=1 Tax=Pontiella desulfatans TaxID=2750659 RepID=A0A6C2U0U6_PONDE|nr:hypothetical protein [Pontiella desulfatans]VGO13211.1 hypothetical protein PDESU_01765 [Pontiella desulfatans]